LANESLRVRNALSQYMGQKIAGLARVDQSMAHFSQVSQSDMPALFVATFSVESAQLEQAQFARMTANYDVIIYIAVPDGDDEAATALGMLDQVRKAFDKQAHRSIGALANQDGLDFVQIEKAVLNGQIKIGGGIVHQTALISIPVQITYF